MSASPAGTVATTPGDFPSSAKNAAPPHVLVVDDEPLVRWAIAETLSDLGYEVAEAENADAAKRAVLEIGPPDVAVLDLRLPDADDLGLAFFIRTHAPAAAILLMTAFATPEILAAAASFGIPILTKPFDMSELSAVVDRILALRSL